jgi:hypothetical protein
MNLYISGTGSKPDQIYSDYVVNLKMAMCGTPVLDWTFSAFPLRLVCVALQAV